MLFIFSTCGVCLKNTLCLFSKHETFVFETANVYLKHVVSVFYTCDIYVLNMRCLCSKHEVFMF